MLRQERFGAGMADQKDLDVEMATAITRDGKFENDLDYMDDNAERLGRKKMRSDAMKRQFAINGRVIPYVSGYVSEARNRLQEDPKGFVNLPALLRGG